MIKFEKVSFEQFEKDYAKCIHNCSNVEYMYEHCCISRETVKQYYDEIKLPSRATSGSAGYDFYAPCKFTIHPRGGATVPTGIRCKMDSDVVLQLYPRSSLGFEWGMSLSNTVGIIDSDYYNSDNEGHILFQFKIGKGFPCSIKRGCAMAQGVLLRYLTTDDDNATGIRNGGFGSTDVPECYKPSKGSYYTLCEGSGEDKCKKCNLWEDYVQKRIIMSDKVKRRSQDTFLEEVLVVNDPDESCGFIEFKIIRRDNREEIIKQNRYADTLIYCKLESSHQTEYVKRWQQSVFTCDFYYKTGLLKPNNTEVRGLLPFVINESTNIVEINYYFSSEVSNEMS